MEFEFLEFSLVGSHWMVFSARFSYKSHPLFHPFARIPLLQEFCIIIISLFHDENIEQEGLWSLQSTKYLQNGSLDSYLNCMMFFLIRAVLWMG